VQAQAFVDVPYIPLGAFYNPSVYRRDVTDIVHGGDFLEHPAGVTTATGSRGNDGRGRHAGVVRDGYSDERPPVVLSRR
jgi:hypothetical protein